MGKKIKNRDGFFKTMAKYHSNEGYTKLQEEMREEELEFDKKDKWAMIISAYLVIFLPVILILAIVFLVAFLVFGFI